jgi:hypothetical protein
MKITKLLFVFVFFPALSNAYFAITDSLQTEKKQNYQIFLKQPAKEIKVIMYEKNFLPIQGKLSEDRKSVIMNDYQTGNKVRLKVLYEDGTVDEFVKSPCFIDPVILLP